MRVRIGTRQDFCTGWGSRLGTAAPTAQPWKLGDWLQVVQCDTSCCFKVPSTMSVWFNPQLRANRCQRYAYGACLCVAYPCRARDHCSERQRWPALLQS